MAEEKEKEGEAPAAPAEKPKKGGMGKLLLIGGGVILIIAAIGVPVTLYMLKGKTDSVEELDADAAHEEGGHGLSMEGALDEPELLEGEEPLGGLLPLDTFVVNLKGGRYLRVQMQMEFVERDIPKKVFIRLPLIRDAMLALLAGRSADEILTPQGRDALKRDIRDLINESLRKEDVKNVFFTQFVVQ